jgi:guanylate kinase
MVNRCKPFSLGGNGKGGQKSKPEDKKTSRPEDKKTMTGKSVIISAPSGAGKTTIVRHLLDSGLNLAFSVSATTRKPRQNEKHGTDYYFLSTNEFRKKIEKGDFVEYEEVYENILYGTLKSEMERIWSSGNQVLFDVDVKGGVNLKKILGTNALAIFLMPPSVDELEKRLVARGTETAEKIRMRVDKAKEEMLYADRFDLIVVNKILDVAKAETLRIVSSFLKS